MQMQNYTMLLQNSGPEECGVGGKPQRRIETFCTAWWKQTNQQGNLIGVADVEQASVHRLSEWMNLFGGFDLVIGGSPCNNLAGGNRVSKHGVEGKQPSLFFNRCSRFCQRQV